MSDTNGQPPQRAVDRFHEELSNVNAIMGQAITDALAVNSRHIRHDPPPEWEGKNPIEILHHALTQTVAYRRWSAEQTHRPADHDEVIGMLFSAVQAAMMLCIDRYGDAGLPQVLAFLYERAIVFDSTSIE